MSRLTSNRILYWIIAFLIMTNAATIGTILYHNYKFKKHLEHRGKRKYKFDKKEHKQREARIDKMFRNQLKLTDEQTENFKLHRKRFSSKAKTLMYDMHIERKNFLQELSNNEVDTLEIKQIAQRLGDLHKQMKIETMYFYMQLNEECTTEQKTKLAKIFTRFIRRSEFDDRPRKFRHRKRKQKSRENL